MAGEVDPCSDYSLLGVTTYTCHVSGLDVSNSAAGSLVSQTVNEREFAVNRHLRAKEEEFTRAEVSLSLVTRP